MLDKLIPQIEQMRSEGAIVLLKWDGQRTSNCCTVVVSHPSTDYVWRKDCEDPAAVLEEAIADYQVFHKS